MFKFAPKLHSHKKVIFLRTPSKLSGINYGRFRSYSAYQYQHSGGILYANNKNSTVILYKYIILWLWWTWFTVECRIKIMVDMIELSLSLHQTPNHRTNHDHFMSWIEYMTKLHLHIMIILKVYIYTFIFKTHCFGERMTHSMHYLLHHSY